MAKPILFVVHGMGKHKTGWEKEVKKTLSDATPEYPFLADTKLSRMAKIVPLTYDDEFEKLRKLWKDDSQKVIKVMQKPDNSDKFQSLLSPFEGDKLLEIQSGLGEDNFFNTHVLDVLLYRFTSIGEKIRVKVAKDIVKTLLDEDEEVPSWSIMAHSLGTAVTHDTLHALYADKIWREGKVNKLFKPGEYTATAVIMLANVSRVLQSRVKVYKSRVKPGSRGVCDYFINAFHMFDPFARIKQFEPGDEWLKGQNADDLYAPIPTNVINQPNVHAYAHYLENPKVHVPIFRVLNGEDSINDKEFKTAYDKFFKASPNSSFQDFGKKLKKLNIGEPESFQAVLEAWSNYANILEQFKGQIDGPG